MDLAIDYFSNENLGDVGGCGKGEGTLISIVQPLEEKRPANCTEKDVDIFSTMEPNGGQLSKIAAPLSWKNLNKRLQKLILDGLEVKLSSV
ncbi:zinc-binding oxidoreductase [Blastomyces dermatitidis ATCC 18188]|uniref:Zinc-binding oxidoreductase n=1 Tax=Ajellomyces dermatitidis (strain ATCC 18188 / CBS 674.68) TaxID=653446 RepID=F2TT73_AJEDA|nr:zinc-binding oxidoreductase [Blastomyces dermatitidis ATCC 18188]